MNHVGGEAVHQPGHHASDSRVGDARREAIGRECGHHGGEQVGEVRRRQGPRYPGHGGEQNTDGEVAGVRERVDCPKVRKETRRKEGIRPCRNGFSDPLKPPDLHRGVTAAAGQGAKWRASDPHVRPHEERERKERPEGDESLSPSGESRGVLSAHECLSRLDVAHTMTKQ